MPCWKADARGLRADEWRIWSGAENDTYAVVGDSKFMGKSKSIMFWFSNIELKN